MRRGCCASSCFPIKENRFDARAEQPRDLEGQRQAGVVLAGFDGVDRLSRDVQPLAEFGLRPGVFLAQFANAVFHRARYRHLFQPHTSPYTMHNAGNTSSNINPPSTAINFAATRNPSAALTSPTTSAEMPVASRCWRRSSSSQPSTKRTTATIAQVNGTMGSRAMTAFSQTTLSCLCNGQTYSITSM